MTALGPPDDWGPGPLGQQTRDGRPWRAQARKVERPSLMEIIVTLGVLFTLAVMVLFTLGILWLAWTGLQ